ncbi:MAG: hypothetical protein QOC63_3732, partial [Mycobacterium sp.]|nr:hypothetical protein [Mycobacterium sp.]
AAPLTRPGPGSAPLRRARLAALGRSRAARPLRTRVGRRGATGAVLRCFARGYPALDGVANRWPAEVAAREHLGFPGPFTGRRAGLATQRGALGFPSAVALLAGCTARALTGRRPLTALAGRGGVLSARWRPRPFGLAALCLRFLMGGCGRPFDVGGRPASLVVSLGGRTLDTVIVRWSKRARGRSGMRCRGIRVGRPQPGLFTLPGRWRRCRVRRWRWHVRPGRRLRRGRPTRRRGCGRLGVPAFVRWRVVAAFAVGHSIHPIGGFAEYPHIGSGP